MRHLILAFIIGLIFPQPTVNAQDSTGTIHFVYGSDTSTPGINVRDNIALYSNSGFELYHKSNRNAETVFSEAYRNQFLDSYGNPLVLTWWMQGGSLYRNATNTNIPYGSTMSSYLMQRYRKDAITSLGDEYTFHYHTWVWSDVNGDGRYYWNQAFDFAESQYDFEISLAEHLIEEDMFPVSFRSGWHYMDNRWQAYLNDWIPYSLHNDSPVKTNPTEEPIDNLIDWGHATLDFIPFQPSDDDYQIGGGNRGWNTRSRYFLRLSENELHSIFQKAREGQDQIACIWVHLADNGFVSNMETSLNLLYEIAALYPDVPFRFSTAVDAYQDFLQALDTTSPQMDVNLSEQSGRAQYIVQSDEPLFQRVPFLAVKTIYESFMRLEMEEIGENRWQNVDQIDLEQIASWAVAVTDTVGNQTKARGDLVARDIFIDNEDLGFTVQKGTWNVLSYPDINHYWGKDVTLFELAPKDTAGFVWETEVEASLGYRLFVRWPDVESNIDSVRVEILHNGTPFYNEIFYLTSSNQWHFITTTPETGNSDEVEIRIEAINKSSQVVSIGADVVKLSALPKLRSLTADPTWINHGETVLNRPDTISIELWNDGREPTTISQLTSTISYDILTDFPLVIDSYQRGEIQLVLTPDEPGVYFDTLRIESNAINASAISIPLKYIGFPEFTLVDNTHANDYKETGNWSNSVTQAIGKSSRYSPINSSNPAMATYSFHAEKAGLYNVNFIVPKTKNAALRALYSEYVNEIEQRSLILNQNHNSGTWVLLNQVYLNVGDDYEVKVEAADYNQGNRVLRADAMRLIYVGEGIDSQEFDNSDESYSETGSWNYSSANGYLGDSRYANFGENTWAEYKSGLNTSGFYTLFLLLPETVNAAVSALYQVYQGTDLVTEFTINQNDFSGNWRPIGQAILSVESEVTVRVSGGNSDPGGVIRADAIRWSIGGPVNTSLAQEIKPDLFKLYENYPNPFNPETIIRFELPKNEKTTLIIYNVLGQKAAQIFNEMRPAGIQQVRFNASGLSSGVYFYELKTSENRAIGKMVLVK